MSPDPDAFMLMHVGEYMCEYGGEYVHEGVGTVTVATAPERAKGYGGGGDTGRTYVCACG